MRYLYLFYYIFKLKTLNRLHELSYNNNLKGLRNDI